MAAFSCNSVYPAHGGDISKSDIIQNVKNIKPDLLFFAGDQVYDHSEHYVYWLKFGQDFGEITRIVLVEEWNIKVVAIVPDEHIRTLNDWPELLEVINDHCGVRVSFRVVRTANRNRKVSWVIASHVIKSILCFKIKDNVPHTITQLSE